MVDKHEDPRAGIRPRDLRPSWSESSRFVPERFVQPVLRYMRTEAAGGVVLLVAALAALVWANSPWAAGYERLWGAHLTVELGGLLHLDHTLREWVNDALMVIFFFVVGLEIKRELAVGELRDPKAAALPAIAALGGMVVPAGAYLAFNAGTPATGGWGIPMATDIAFALGVVSLVGTRVPIGAKLFLLALAIVDDIGAILVIAVFYTDTLSVGWLATAVVGLGVVVVMRRIKVRAMLAYGVVGVVVWLGLLESGVHATLAGVALGLLTPATPFYRPDDFAGSARGLVDRVDEYAGDPRKPEDLRTTERIQALLGNVRRLSRETISPLERLESAVEPWSSFLVVPVFAFANAGVVLSGRALADAVTNPISVGVFLGLLAGKLVGVSGASWLAVRTGLGQLPPHTTWRHVIGTALLAGIGFTVALFITTLAFTDPARVDAAKIGIFAASLVAGIAGYLWLRTAPRPAEDPHGAEEALATT